MACPSAGVIRFRFNGFVLVRTSQAAPPRRYPLKSIGTTARV